MHMVTEILFALVHHYPTINNLQTMFWFLKNDILKILDATQKEREALQNHRIYRAIKSLDHLHIFMESHIFAVWDFMSILKSLQRKLTCVDIPWVPKGKGTPSRLVNEIVKEEESDIDQYGQHMSHFEMYCHAMKQAGANITPINTFLNEIQHLNVRDALNKSDALDHSKVFVNKTFEILKDAPEHVVASIFTFGREEVIPSMFKSILNELDKKHKGKIKSFIYYLDRHIGLDENEHTPAALKMVKKLCQNDEDKWVEATNAARSAMQARITFWDGILSEIN